MRFTERRGEPLISFFDPKTFPKEISDLGFELLENLSPREQEARYCSERKDYNRTLPTCYFAHIQLNA